MRLRKLFFEPDHGDGDSFRASHDIVTGLVMALRSDKAGWRLHLHPDGPGSQPRHEASLAKLLTGVNLTHVEVQQTTKL